VARFCERGNDHWSSEIDGVFLTRWTTISFLRKTLFHARGRRLSEHSVFSLCKSSMYLLRYISSMQADIAIYCCTATMPFYRTSRTSLAIWCAVTNRWVNYLPHATSVPRPGIRDNRACCPAMTNCVILQPRRKQRNVHVCCLATRPPSTWMDFD
jgi:hypothetical protein